MTYWTERHGGEQPPRHVREAERIADSAAAELRRADQRVRDIMAAALEQVKHIGENLPSAGYAERHNRYYDFMLAVDGAVADNMPEVE